MPLMPLARFGLRCNEVSNRFASDSGKRDMPRGGTVQSRPSSNCASTVTLLLLAARGRCGFCCEQDEDVGTQNEGVESRHRCTFLFCADQKRDPELQENQQVVRGVALPATRCSFPE